MSCDDLESYDLRESLVLKRKEKEKLREKNVFSGSEILS